jgi:hypothetical protein
MIIHILEIILATALVLVAFRKPLLRARHSILMAWVNFRIGIARRRNARLAIDTLDVRTQLLHSPLQKYSAKKLRQLARRHPKAAAGCAAEIKRRQYIGKHRDEIFLKAAAAIAILIAPSAFAGTNTQDQVSATSVPWSITSYWILGLLGFLAVVYLVLAVWGKIKEVFGKKPSNQEELVSIHKKIYAFGKSVDERFQNLQVERQRTLSELNEKISRVAEDVAFIRGQMSTKP